MASRVAGALFGPPPPPTVGPSAEAPEGLAGVAAPTPWPAPRAPSASGPRSSATSSLRTVPKSPASPRCTRAARGPRMAFHAVPRFVAPKAKTSHSCWSNALRSTSAAWAACRPDSSSRAFCAVRPSLALASCGSRCAASSDSFPRLPSSPPLPLLRSSSLPRPPRFPVNGGPLLWGWPLSPGAWFLRNRVQGGLGPGRQCPAELADQAGGPPLQRPQTRQQRQPQHKRTQDAPTPADG